MRKKLIIIFVFMIIIYISFIKLYERNSYLKMKNLIKQYASTLELAVWSIDTESIKKIADVILNSENISYIKIYDESNNLFYEKNKKIKKIFFITENKTIKGSIQHDGIFLGSLEINFLNNNNLVYLYVALVFVLFYFIIYLNFKFLQNNLKLKDEIKNRVKIEDELKETYETLNKAYNDLKMAHIQLIENEKMAALGNLVAGVAHEINTPVGISLTAISLIKSKTFEIKKAYENNEIKKSEFEDFLNIVEESSIISETNLIKAAKLVKSFKDVAVDRMSEEKRKFNLRSYIEDVLLSLHTKYKHRNIKINIDCNENIVIDGYPGLFSQIITNLVMNSLIHGFEGKESGEINIYAKREENKLIFIYEDNGIGIKKESIKKIFEPFYTTKRGQGGSGLGLNIVYNIVVQKFKGSITCESNQGTKFKIIIPLGVDSND